MTVSIVFYKSAAATNVDFLIDWEDWLATGEAIQTATWTLPSGLTQGSSGQVVDGTTTAIFLDGGTKGQAYEVACQIVTDQGRDPQRSIIIKVK